MRKVQEVLELPRPCHAHRVIHRDLMKRVRGEDLVASGTGSPADQFEKRAAVKPLRRGPGRLHGAVAERLAFVIGKRPREVQDRGREIDP
jgi:hypothetical protein